MECERLARAIEILGLKDTDAADILGISRTTLYKWLQGQGQIPPRTAEKLAAEMARRIAAVIG